MLTYLATIEMPAFTLAIVLMVVFINGLIWGAVAVIMYGIKAHRKNGQPQSQPMGERHAN